MFRHRVEISLALSHLPQAATGVPTEDRGGRPQAITRRGRQREVYGMISAHEDMKKGEALRRMNRSCRGSVLNNRNTHFSNINHTEPVWWFHIPLVKICGSCVEEFLHIVCYDRRSYKLSHLIVPTSYFNKHLTNPNKLRQHPDPQR